MTCWLRPEPMQPSRAELNERSGRWRVSMTRNPTAAGSSCSARRASVTREAYLEDAIGAYILYQQESERKTRPATVSTTGAHKVRRFAQPSPELYGLW